MRISKRLSRLVVALAIIVTDGVLAWSERITGEMAIGILVAVGAAYGVVKSVRRVRSAKRAAEQLTGGAGSDEDDE